jgi:hypothetical protein
MRPTNDSFEHLAAESCASLFDQFITQRRFLANLSPATIRWYGDAAKALLPLLPLRQRNSPIPPPKRQ